MFLLPCFYTSQVSVLCHILINTFPEDTILQLYSSLDQLKGQCIKIFPKT